ncbi:glycosyltransferase family 2 protein [Croceifilum oryzae]|nr:glycosyltransferase family 2 protein [Croceifilum oryzae]
MMISIIAPCYNEQDVLYDFYQTVTKVMKENQYSYEIVFVNDGSRDQTLSILKELGEKDRRVQYISFSRNFGKESAMLAGLSYSKGDAVIIMDTDLQHPPSMIPRMVEAFQNGSDQVIAKRNRAGESKSRSWVSSLYYKLINRFVDVQLEDGVGDFRLLSRKAVDSLLSLSEYNRFSKGLFSWIGYKQEIIEYENVSRHAGDSKWSFFSLLNYGIDGIISFNNKPLRLSIYSGVAVMVADVFYVLWMLVKIFLGGVDVPGYFTLISAILLLGGIQLVALGVIGEYIGRIYYETKKRPHYIVADDNYTQVSQSQNKIQKVLS